MLAQGRPCFNAFLGFARHNGLSVCITLTLSPGAVALERGVACVRGVRLCDNYDPREFLHLPTLIECVQCNIYTPFSFTPSYTSMHTPCSLEISHIINLHFCSWNTQWCDMLPWNVKVVSPSSLQRDILLRLKCLCLPHLVMLRKKIIAPRLPFEFRQLLWVNDW